MVSESVLDELVRATALRQHLVEMAWPSLSTESKLQVIQAIQADFVSMSTPNWLLKLAIDDPEPVVRYWSARHAYFNATRPGDFDDRLMQAPASEEELELYAKASRDASIFVRCCIDSGETFDYMHLSSLSQIERLLFTRRLTMPSILPFIEWLEDAVENGVPDSDLRDCAHEFFMHPVVRKDMGRKGADFVDGFDAHQRGKAIRKGWNLTKVAGPGLCTTLAFALPTSYGLGTMSVEEIAELSDGVLSTLIYRKGESNEIDDVIQLMNNHPERFSSQLQQRLNSDDDIRELVPDEIEEKLRMSAIKRQEATLEVALEIRQQLNQLQSQIQDTQAEASKRRGFFR